MIYAPHAPEKAKLAEVVAQMQVIGAPAIHAVWQGDHYKALEGSHRLAAAAQLGLPVTIVEMAEGDYYDHDWADVAEKTVMAILTTDGYWTTAYDVETLIGG